MTAVSYTRAVDVLLLLSNLVLLVPAITAYKWNLYTRAIIIFVEVWGSFFYHSCDSFNVCLGLPFSLWHVVDFTLATWLVWQAGLYLIVFKPRYKFIERWLLLLGLFFIALLVAAFPQSEAPILGAAGLVFLVVVLYWLFYAWYASGKGKYYKLPAYNWDYFLLGAVTLGGSTMLFVVQTTLPDGYWGIHSLWHAMAGIGMTWLIMVKDPAHWWQTSDKRIQKRVTIRPVLSIMPH